MKEPGRKNIGTGGPKGTPGEPGGKGRPSPLDRLLGPDNETELLPDRKLGIRAGAPPRGAVERAPGQSAGEPRPDARAGSGASTATIPEPTGERSDADILDQYERLRRAAEKEPQVTSHRLVLADLCVRLDRKEEARGILMRIIDQDPKHRARALEILGKFLSEAELSRISIREEPIPFWNDAARILQYPLKGNGPALLIGGGLVFTLLGILVRISSIYAWLPLLVILGYTSSYMMTIIDSSARGKREPPDYPDFLSLGDSVLGPLWISICAGLIPLALPILYLIFIGLDLGLLPLILVGLAYWPMALIAGSIFQSAWQPLNVPLVLATMRITAREYFPAVFTIYGLTFANWLLALVIGQILPSIITGFVVQIVGLYFLMVEMDILGRIYYNYEQEIGWFAANPRTLPETPAAEEGSESQGAPPKESHPQ